MRDGRLKRRVNVLEAVLENIGEAKQDGCAQAAMLEAIDQPFEIDAARRVARGMNLEMSLLVDREVALTPACDVVQLSGFGQRPRRGYRTISEPGQTTHLLKKE